MDLSYQNSQYWALPKNVRTAIDNAKQKSQHSEFFYKLQDLNDKIIIYRSIFYNKLPFHQELFRLKKEKEEKIKAKLLKEKQKKKEEAEK